MVAEEPIFTLAGVTQERGGRTTLDDIDLAIPRGKTTALIGPSGAGKTSLLRLLNRLDDPARGQVKFDGAPIIARPVRELRRNVGFVFQRPTMFQGTVEHNLRAALELGAPRGATRAELASVLASAGLDESYMDRDASALSGGEQQRVSIARALVVEPQALLLDEPTSALDPEVAERLIATIAALNRDRGMTIVMVTHRLGEARSASTFTVMLEAGRVIESGATRDLFGGAREARTRDYLRSESSA